MAFDLHGLSKTEAQAGIRNYALEKEAAEQRGRDIRRAKERHLLAQGFTPEEIKLK